jgi:RNA polymerase sigma-70 factor, ECF subfamily
VARMDSGLAAEVNLLAVPSDPSAREAGASVAATALEESELVERVRRGDVAAFDVLVERHMRRAFAVAYRVLGHREDAEDLVQDAFLAALEKLDTFQPGRSFGPWLYRIVVNRGLNARKARSLRETDPISPDVSSATPSPLRETERSELRTHLAAAMRELPERQRTVVQLVELEGFSSAEVAEMLDLSDGTVRWHLHQARQRLRQVLEPFSGRSR